MKCVKASLGHIYNSVQQRIRVLAICLRPSRSCCRSNTKSVMPTIFNRAVSKIWCTGNTVDAPPNGCCIAIALIRIPSNQEGNEENGQRNISALECVVPASCQAGAELMKSESLPTFSGRTWSRNPKQCRPRRPVVDWYYATYPINCNLAHRYFSSHVFDCFGM